MPRTRALTLAMLLLTACGARYAQPPRCLTAARATAPGGPALDDSDAIPTRGAPSLGPRDAPVTVVVFSDFQCPYCNRGRHTIADLRAAFPDAVRVVWRNLPLPRHEQAVPAAEAAMEAFAQGGDAAFWRFHDLLFGHQEHLLRNDLERYAAMAGLDLVRFRHALDEGVHAEAIEADRALAASLGADGTPAFFVNGTPIEGAQPIEVFEALAQAIVERAHGAPVPHGFYADMVRSPLPTPERPGSRNDWAQVHDVPVPEAAPSLGPTTATIVMQVFSDFECPYCSRVEPTIAALREAYGDRLRVVWRDYPLPGHPDAMPAAEAAREVRAQRGEAAFWRFHDALFADQQHLARADLERQAVAAGADLARFRAALDDHRHVAAVRADMEAITATGVRFGTPAFFLNGHFIAGARPLADFRARVEGLLTAR